METLNCFKSDVINYVYEPHMTHYTSINKMYEIYNIARYGNTLQNIIILSNTVP